MNGFAELIKSRRGELGLDTETVADAIDRSEAVLTAWEDARTFPEDPAIVEPLAKVLRLPKALLAEAYAQSGPSIEESAKEVEDRSAEGAFGEALPEPPPGAAPPPPGPPVTPPAPEPVTAVAAPDRTAELEAQAPPAHRPAYEPPRTVRADPIVAPQPPPAREDRDVVEQVLTALSSPFEALARRFRRNRWTSRAPVSQLSYTEDRKQRTTYQLRAIFTGVAVLVMILLIRWAWSQFAEAFGTLWETLVGAI